MIHSDEKPESFLRERATEGFVSWSVQVEAAERFNLSLAEIEERILKSSLLPLRYRRNTETFSQADQLTFFHSKVTVVGCGGLGGYIIEELARLGIGRLRVIDHDRFDETNLNRQLNASLESMGKYKAQAAADRVAKINPAVSCEAIIDKFTRENGVGLLQQSSVVVDGLDSIATRLDLSRICQELNIPLVHGAIGGWYGQVAVQHPGDNTIERLYEGHEEAQGIEKKLGNPPFTPALVASIEVAEVCKLLLGRDNSLREHFIFFDLSEQTLHHLKI